MTLTLAELFTAQRFDAVWAGLARELAGVVFLGEGLSTRLMIASVIVLGGIGLALVGRR